MNRGLVLRGDWVKSSYSEMTGCVEVRADRHSVRIRDSKQRSGDVLKVSPGAWAVFVRHFFG